MGLVLLAQCALQHGESLEPCQDTPPEELPWAYKLKVISLYCSVTSHPQLAVDVVPPVSRMELSFSYSITIIECYRRLRPLSCKILMF